jgi:predicted dinucleotide-binding enzyme
VTGFAIYRGLPGHEVLIGTRDPAKLADWSAKNQQVRVADVEETSAFGEVVVLAVKGSAAAAAVRTAGPATLEGKVVIDTCNPIADSPPADGVLRFTTNLDTSLLEQLQAEFPAVRFVKAFNSVGAGAMVNPRFQGGRPTMFICGDDISALEFGSILRVEHSGGEVRGGFRAVLVSWGS